MTAEQFDALVDMIRAINTEANAPSHYGAIVENSSIDFAKSLFVESQCNHATGHERKYFMDGTSQCPKCGAVEAAEKCDHKLGHIVGADGVKRCFVCQGPK